MLCARHLNPKTEGNVLIHKLPDQLICRDAYANQAMLELMKMNAPELDRVNVPRSPIKMIQMYINQ